MLKMHLDGKTAVIVTDSPNIIEQNDDGEVYVYHGKEAMTYAFIRFHELPQGFTSHHGYLSPDECRRLSSVLADLALLIDGFNQPGMEFFEGIRVEHVAEQEPPPAVLGPWDPTPALWRHDPIFEPDMPGTDENGVANDVESHTGGFQLWEAQIKQDRANSGLTEQELREAAGDPPIAPEDDGEYADRGGAS